MTLPIDRLQKLGLLGSLYISQFMPFWFLYQGLPVLLRQQGLSLAAIGLLPAILLPVTLKFLWSPLIDGYGFTRWGHYRVWIIGCQLWVVVLTLICSGLKIETQLPLILGGLLLIALGCASQDIATDALACGLLKPEERGLGNAIQGIGGSLGSLIGGGGMLILLNRWGWQVTLWMLAGLLLLALLPLLFHSETIPPEHLGWERKARPGFSLCRLRNYGNIFFDICQRPGMRVWLLFLGLATAGYNLAATMFRPLLVDVGLSLEAIGWLMGVFGMTLTMVGSLIAGLLISRVGRVRSLILALSLSLLGTLADLLPTFGFTQLPVFYGAISLTFLALGVMGTTSFTIMMDNSRQGFAGTDYTLQASVIPFSSILSAACSGLLAGVLGYRGVFLVSFCLVLLSLGILLKYLNPLDPQPQSSPDYSHAHHS